MNAIVLHDSQFGNTKIIAEVIYNSINNKVSSRLVDLKTIYPESFEMPDLLIVGAPTQKFNPSEATKVFLNKLPDNILEGKLIAAFDTRISLAHIDSKMLRFIVDKGGYAAKKIDKGLQKKGGKSIILPEGFCVKDTEGPLLEEEIAKAKDWAKRILDIVKKQNPDN